MAPVLYPGLPISTPHGVGVVVRVRNDGMIVTKLAGTNPNGAGGYTGYFHPTSIAPVPSSSIAPVRSGSAPPFLPSTATLAPVGMFQPVATAETSPAPPLQQHQLQAFQFQGQQQGFQFQQQQQQQQQQQPGFHFQPQQQPQQQPGFQFQQPQQQQQQLAGQPFRTPDRSCATPPPASKRRRSAGGEFFVHVHN